MTLYVFSNAVPNQLFVVNKIMLTYFPKKKKNTHTHTQKEKIFENYEKEKKPQYFRSFVNTLTLNLKV